MNNIEELVRQVLVIDPSKSRADIRVDLEYTKSVEATINRIFDGLFLHGTERDPSKTAVLIIDSDDDDANIHDENNQASQQRELSPPVEPKPITSQDSLQELSFDVNSQDNNNNNVTIAKTNARSILIEDTSNDFYSPSPSPSTNNAFCIQQDNTQNIDHSNDSDEPLPSSPPSFLLLDDDNEQTETTPEKDKPSSSIFGRHFDDDDDTMDVLPSAMDFFDDLLIQKPATPVIEIDDFDNNEGSDDDNTIENSDEENNDDIFEIVSSSAHDRKGKRRAYEFDPSFETLHSNRRRRLDEVAIDDIELLTGAERKEKERQEKKQKREQLIEEKRRKKAEMLEEKQRLKEQKLIEKERKSLFEKENRIRADRNKILKEIIVDIHPDFLKTKAGQLLELVLTKKEAEIHDLFQRISNPSYTLSWRRKTNSEWDQDSQAFIPLSRSKIVQEPVVLVYINIPEFTQHIQNKTIDRYIDILERDADGCQIILLIEGLEVYYKKKMLLKRRQFELQVRNSFNEAEGSTHNDKRNNDLTSLQDGPSQNDVEECLNYLQLVHGIMLVPTKDDEDTASWIESLTTDLALGRYKTKNINNVYKVGKSGSNPKDTYLKMLQEIQLCTPAIAESVASSYPTLQSLHRAYQRKNIADGELLLADLEVERSALRLRDRKINRVMSKKIYTIFNSDDPEQIIY